MARTTGPKCRYCRRDGTKLFLKGSRCYTAKCAVERRKTAPGAHGAFKGQMRLSQYGLRMREKQKAKRIYGLFEKQFRNYFAQASKSKTSTGQSLLQFLELRLDSFVHTLGLASSRDQARQLVSHGSILVNGKRVSIASYQIKVGDTISFTPRAARSAYVQALKGTLKDKKDFPDWVSLNKETLEGRVLRMPTRKDVALPINDQYIIEYYSR